MMTESSSAPCPAPKTRCCHCNGTAKCLRCACVRSGTPCSRCLPGVSGRCHNTLPCGIIPHPALPAATTQFLGNPLAGVSSSALTYAPSPLAVSSTPSTVSPPTSPHRLPPPSPPSLPSLSTIFKSYVPTLWHVMFVGVSPQAPVNVAKCVTRRTSLDRVSKQTLTARAKTTVKLNNFKTNHSKVQGVVTNYTCGHRPIYM